MTTLPATRRMQQETESGIRPFDLGRDLRPVAELISRAFANELDARGTAALREMRIMSRMSGFIRLLNRSTGEFDDVFSGFVWVEDGKVIGNVTVQRSTMYSDRWQIANVAVAHGYRERGIASSLLHQAIEHIRRLGGRWAVLQVYDNNEVARKLYRRMGFEEIGGTIDLQCKRVSATLSPRMPENFKAFSPNSWRALYDLVNVQFGAQKQWWRSIRRSDFQLTFEQHLNEWFWHFVGRRRYYRYAIGNGSRFDAALIMTAQRWNGEHEVALWIRPELYGHYEDVLAQWIVAQLQEYPRLPVNVTINGDHIDARAAFERHGFTMQQNLLTMRRKISER